MKNNDRPYYQILLLSAFLILTSSVFAQKSNRRYTEAEILAEAHFIEADALFLQGKYNDAIDKFKAFLLEHKDIAIAHFQMGRAYDALDEHVKSMISIEKAVQLDPTNQWFLITQAALYEQSGQSDKSAEVMQALIKVAPESAFAYKKAAFYYLLSQMPDKAIKVLNQGEQRIGFDVAFNQRKHVIYLAKGNNKAAINELKEILKHFPKNTKPSLQLANIYQSIGQPDDAEKQYRSILSYDPFNAEALVGLQNRNIAEGSSDIAQLLQLMADPNVSIDLKITEIVPIISKASPRSSDEQKSQWTQLMETMQTQHPTSAKAASVAGDMYNAIGEYDKALVQFQRALQKEKSVFSLWQETLELLFLKKEYAQVIETTNDAMNYFPNKSRILLYLAESQFRTSKPDAAIDAYKQATYMSGRNHHQKRFIYGRLAEIYLANGDLKNADKYVNKAIKIDDAKDPYIEHVQKEVKQKQPILYSGKWIQMYPYAIFLI